MNKKEDVINPYVIPGLIRDQLSDSALEKINCWKNNMLNKEQLIEIIAAEANISIKLIFSTVRESEYVFARNIYTKIQKIYGKKLTEIGRDISKDHTTIIHSLKQFENRYTLEDGYRELSNKIFHRVGIDPKNVKNEYFNRTSKR
jgi:chromosomal replication initiation ATPase DnaA